MRIARLILFLGLTALIVSAGSADVHATGAQDAPVKDDIPRTTGTAPGESFSFQAEVSRLMDIIINSLYSNKDIFLRELISNASDALDKLRFLSLTNKKLLGESDDAKLEIYISADKEAKTLKIRDKGIGMNKEDLINNLGTIARSGTTKFLEAMQQSQDSLSLIGQFGVGFYSAYLVADRVRVTSKKPDEEQWVWESDAKDTFQVFADPNGSTLGHHGTEITLFLKDDAVEYLEQDNLAKIIERYSEFINFPIYLYKSKTVKEEVPADPEEESEEETSKPDEDELEVVEEDEGPKTKTVSKTVYDWEKVNDYVPIWTRSKDAITEEEYQKFYRSAMKDNNEALTWSHFKGEGGVDFTALLYIPSAAPMEIYEKYYQKSASLKLYVRRVLLADEFEDFMPRYLNFVKGVVDSDDLPINVSRETLQKDKILQVIGKRLVRNVLKMLSNLADREEKVVKEDKENEESTEEEKDVTDAGNEKATYSQFWKEFGKSIKLGVIEDSKNRNKLLKLLRFPSTTSGDKVTGLDGYIERMVENQTDIYYIAGESIDAVKDSPMLDEPKRRGYEVLYLVDPIDEYLVGQISGYDGYSLVSVAQEGVKFGNAEEETAKFQEEYKKFCSWFQKLLGSKVEKVIVSSRVATTPAVVTTSQFGWSANMERIMKAQPVGEQERMKFMVARKTLEINPHNVLVAKLKELYTQDSSNPQLHESARLIYDAALLSSGFAHEEPLTLVKRLERTLGSALGMETTFPEIAFKDEPQGETEEDTAPEEKDEL